MDIDSNHKDIIRALHDELAIPETYGESCGLEFCQDCKSLIETELDVFGRQPLMAPTAFTAWHSMQKKALEEGIELQIVSAFRSAEYQAELFRKRLAQGDTIENILKVNAAPGFSEHHSGCALDITTPGFEPLSESFENSDAFEWLKNHASDFGFSMSFPRDNAAGMSYEPWHWKFTSP